MARAIRRIRHRLAELAEALGEEHAEELAVIKCILAYLDDLVLFVDPRIAADAFEIVRQELGRVGLELSVGKCSCHGPDPGLPADTFLAQLWASTDEQGGVIAVGAPMSGDSADLDDFDIDTAVPVGSSGFIQSFLARYVERIEGLVRQIIALPTQCSPDVCGIQAANLLLRHCAAAKAAHLLRVLPPETTRGFAARIDNLTAAAFEELNGLPQLDGWRATALGLPLRKGGLGFRCLSWATEAAHIGAFAQAAPHVHWAVGLAGGHDNGDATTAAVRAAAAELKRSYGVDCWEALKRTPSELDTVETKKGQKILSDAVMDYLYTHWLDELPALAAAACSSAAGVGASEWLLAPPASRTLAILDADFQILLLTRLRLPIASEGSTCAYFIRSSARTCGSSLTVDADHVHGCCKAPVAARHHALRDTWARICREVGAGDVQVEQHVPELARLDATVADVRSVEHASASARYYDVAVTHPIKHHQGEWQPSGPGQAVEVAERGKLVRYAPSRGGRPVLLTPVCFETYGHAGERTYRELSRLARARALRPDAMSSIDPAGVAKGALLRWRRELSVALQLGNARVLQQAAGRDPARGAHADPCVHSDAVGLLLERG